MHTTQAVVVVPSQPVITSDALARNSQTKFQPTAIKYPNSKTPKRSILRTPPSVMSLLEAVSEGATKTISKLLNLTCQLIFLEDVIHAEPCDLLQGFFGNHRSKPSRSNRYRSHAQAKHAITGSVHARTAINLPASHPR